MELRHRDFTNNDVEAVRGWRVDKVLTSATVRRGRRMLSRAMSFGCGAIFLARAVLASPALPEGPKPSLVVSSGFLESNRMSTVRPASLWISFENRSDQEVLDLHFVDFRTPGLKPSGTCWKLIQQPGSKSRSFPACRPDLTDPTKPVAMPSKLLPGEAVTVTGDVARELGSGDFMITGVYAWLDSAGQQHRSTLSIGPIEVVKHWDDWRARLSEDLPTVLKDVILPVAKDLAWPLAIFLLGWMFKAAEQKRTANQQIWTQMLDKIDEHTTQYYLPISAAISAFTSTRVDVDAIHDKEEPFYFFALLFRRMRELKEKIGGFVFKDRIGEELAISCWAIIFDEFVRNFEKGTGIQQKEVMVNSISSRETLSEYQRKLQPSLYSFSYVDRPKLVKVREGFDRWLQTSEFKNLIQAVMTVFSSVIDYEINRPYDLWYTKRQKFEVTEFVGYEKKLGNWLKDGTEKPAKDAVQELYKLLRRYRHGNTLRQAPWVIRWPLRWLVNRWYDMQLWLTPPTLPTS